MTTPQRLPMSREQRQRLDNLIKQAMDGLTLAAEERLNLDSFSRAMLNEARQSISNFDFIQAQQPITKP